MPDEKNHDLLLCVDDKFTNESDFSVCALVINFPPTLMHSA